MKGPERLQASVGMLKSRMGACYPGSRAVFRGRDLHAELGDLDWMDLYAFGITGRRFSSDQLRLLHALWVHTSYPDARIWNNRAAALAATAGSTPTLGMSAALAVSEATIYGGHPFLRAIDFLVRLRKRADAGEAVDAVVADELARRRIYGYGRPINSVDERLPWLLRKAAELGLDQGPHLALAKAVDRILSARDKPLRMNYAALAAALAADLGMSPEEFHVFVFPAFLAGMPPCFMESADRPEGTLFPLRCCDVLYDGVPNRPWSLPNVSE